MDTPESLDEEIRQLAIRLWRLMRMVEVVMEEIETASVKVEILKARNDNGTKHH